MSKFKVIYETFTNGWVSETFEAPDLRHATEKMQYRAAMSEAKNLRYQGWPYDVKSIGIINIIPFT